MLPTRALFLPAIAAAVLASGASAFTIPSFGNSPAMTTSTRLFYSNNNDDNTDDWDTLQDRIDHLRLQLLEDDWLRPPNAQLNPQEFVQSLLEGIFHNQDPRPDAGFLLLLRCCTEEWAQAVLQSIGAPEQPGDWTTVASALGTAMGRPHNQYAILVGGDHNELVDEQGERNFTVHFPGDTLDFLDGTAWINVEFRAKADNALLVLTGWQLCQRPEDGAWLVDRIDWQDYREEYRPGIGREDWMPFEGRKR